MGLTVASAFGKKLPTLGFDVDSSRIAELKKGYDRNSDIPSDCLTLPNLSFTSDPDGLVAADFLIVSVPTPLDWAKRPDLSDLIEASRIVGRALKARFQEPKANNQRPILVYESTVYPGCTEEVCIPILELESALKAGRDFKVGYSPERINPGDADHTLDKVVKIVSAQDSETLNLIAEIYALVAKAGVYRAPDIRTAEATKVIENVQRDLNVALMNEVAMLLRRLRLDTKEVLKAARTKWNFLPFEPGLVGGDCIPVAPYYLSHKAQEVDFYPELTLAGRRINDSMGFYVARETIKLLVQTGRALMGGRVLVLGASFKENVSDLRNTRIVDLVHELEMHGLHVYIYDPLVDPGKLRELGLNTASAPFGSTTSDTADGSNELGYDAIVLAVAHRLFKEVPPENYLSLLRTKFGLGVLVDVKGVLHGKICKDKVLYWSW